MTWHLYPPIQPADSIAERRPRVTTIDRVAEGRVSSQVAVASARRTLPALTMGDAQRATGALEGLLRGESQAVLVIGDVLVASQRR
jgi:hypothetical protein